MMTAAQRSGVTTSIQAQGGAPTSTVTATCAASMPKEIVGATTATVGYTGTSGPARCAGDEATRGLAIRFAWLVAEGWLYSRLFQQYEPWDDVDPTTFNN